MEVSIPIAEASLPIENLMQGLGMDMDMDMHMHVAMNTRTWTWTRGQPQRKRALRRRLRGGEQERRRRPGEFWRNGTHWMAYRWHTLDGIQLANTGWRTRVEERKWHTPDGRRWTEQVREWREGGAMAVREGSRGHGGSGYRGAVSGLEHTRTYGSLELVGTLHARKCELVGTLHV